MSAFVEIRPNEYDPAAFDGFSAVAKFDVGTARAMMWTAQLAYETHRPKTIAFVRNLWQFDRVTAFSEQDVDPAAIFDSRGIVVDGRAAVILAFAGTDPAVWQNLATDFDIPRLPQSDTHKGFQAAADAVRAHTDAAIALSRQNGRPLMVAGHSLGAAMAVIAAEQAFDAGCAPTAVYVYGMPRAGGASFAARYDGKLGNVTYRLVHGQDLVASVPMSAIGFRHVGRLFACDRGAKFADAGAPQATGSDEPQFTAGILAKLKDGLGMVVAGSLLAPEGPGQLGPLFKYLPMPIRDHLPDRYCLALTP